MKKILKLPVFQIGIIIILTFIIYSGAIKIPFVWDDEVQILTNHFVIKPGFLKEIFMSSVMAGGSAPGGASFYRPLVILFYRFEYILFGQNPAGFHLISLLFHFLNISLVYLLVRKICQKHFPRVPAHLPAFLAGLLFALHPVNVEAVSWIASQGDLIATVSILGAFLLLFSLPPTTFSKKVVGAEVQKEFQSWKYLISAQTLFCLALFAKEPIIVFPVIFLVYLILFFRKNIRAIIKFIIASAIPVLIYAIFRFLIAKIYFSSSLSLISEANSFQRFLTAITSLGNYLKLLVFPTPLFTDRQFLITKLSDYRFIFSFLVIILLIFIFVKIHRKKPIVSFFGLWFFIGIFPGLNLFFPSGPALAERYLYFPAIGLFSLIGLGIFYLFQKFSKVLKIILILFLVVNFGFWGYKIWARNRDWQEPLKLYQHDANLSSNSFLLQTNLGVEYFRRENFNEAEKAFLKAIEIEPQYGVPHNNLGVILGQKGKIKEAISEYKKAIELSNYFLAYINLSDVYLKEKNYEAGILLLEKATNFFPYNPQILSRLTYFYLQKGDSEASQRVARQLLQIDPENEMAKTILQDIQ